MGIIEYNGSSTRARSIWQFFLLSACVVTMALLFFAPAHAALQEMKVLAQGTGATREEAKVNALTYAKQAAFVRVARKLDAEKAPEYLRTLDIHKIEPYIRGIEVLSEQRIEGVYYAQTVVTVIDTPIRKAYGMDAESMEKAASAKDGAARPILVLPVFYNGVEPIVWDGKTNPSMGLWREHALLEGQGALMIPAGDVTERSVVDRDNVLLVKYALLKPLMDRYGADEIVIAVLQDTFAQDKKLSVEMLLRRVRSGGEKIERFTLMPTGDKVTREALYEQAVIKAAARLDMAANATAYKDKKARAVATQQKFVASFTTLQEWAKMQKIMMDAAGIEAIDTISITLHEARGVLYVRGNVSAMKTALETAITINDAGGTWMLRAQK